MLAHRRLRRAPRRCRPRRRGSRPGPRTSATSRRRGGSGSRSAGRAWGRPAPARTGRRSPRRRPGAPTRGSRSRACSGDRPVARRRGSCADQTSRSSTTTVSGNASMSAPASIVVSVRQAPRLVLEPGGSSRGRSRPSGAREPGPGAQRSAPDPARPAGAAVRLLQLLDDPDIDGCGLAEVIETDPTLAARLLQLAGNSPFYGISRGVASVTQATVVVGLSVVHTFAATAAAGVLVKHDGSMPPDYWEHSMAVAAAAAVVARGEGVDANEALTAGLQHDLGTALLFRLDPRRFGVVERAAPARVRRPPRRRGRRVRFRPRHRRRRGPQNLAAPTAHRRSGRRPPRRRRFAARRRAGPRRGPGSPGPARARPRRAAAPTGETATPMTTRSSPPSASGSQLASCFTAA